MKLTSKICQLTLASTISMTVGCGGFDMKKKGRKAKESDNTLSGTWDGTCASRDWLGFSYQKVEFKFNVLGDFEKNMTLFLGSDCDKSVGRLLISGSYSALGKAKNVDQAKDLNLTISSANLVADSTDAVGILNKANYCGKANWQSQKSVDILGKSCLGMDISKGDVVFDIYSIDQKGKRLQTGKSSFFFDKSDANARPEALDDTSSFARK